MRIEIEGWFYMVKTLSKSIRQYKKLSLLSPLFVIGEVIIEMLIPYLVGILIDNGIMKGNMSYISKMGLILLVLTIVSLILGASASYVSAHAAAGFALICVKICSITCRIILLKILIIFQVPV